MASRESSLSYFKTKQEELEVALSTAVRAAVSELHPDPILYVSQHLAAAAAAKSAGNSVGASASGVSAAALATSASARDVTTEHVAEVVGMLGFNFQYAGQLVPPRPTTEEVAAGATVTGPLVSHGGVIVQGGPFGSVWLRVGADGSGAVVDVPWLTMMENLKCYVEHTIAMQRAKSDAGKIPSAIYCAVPLGASQVGCRVQGMPPARGEGRRWHRLNKKSSGPAPSYTPLPPPPPRRRLTWDGSRRAASSSSTTRRPTPPTGRRGRWRSLLVPSSSFTSGLVAPRTRTWCLPTPLRSKARAASSSRRMASRCGTHPEERPRSDAPVPAVLV